MAVLMPGDLARFFVNPRVSNFKACHRFHDISGPTTIGFSPREAYEWVQAGIDTHTVHIYTVRPIAK